MDQAIATVLIAIITGVFSVVTIIIQRNQSKLITKIDEQTIFIDKEQILKQKILQAEKKRDNVIERITILSMNINLLILRGNIDESIIDNYTAQTEKLIIEYTDVSNEIKDISKEYDLLIAMTGELKKELDEKSKKKKK